MNWSLENYWNRLARPLEIASFVAVAAVLLTGCGGEEKGSARGPSCSTRGFGRRRAGCSENRTDLYGIDGAHGRQRLGRDPCPCQGISHQQSYAEGTVVKAGQVLFTLDKREYEAQLMQAQAQMAKAQADLTQAQEKSVVETANANVQIALAQLNKADQDVKRLKPLAEIKAVPQQDYDDALAVQQAARADVEGRQAALEHLQSEPDCIHSTGGGGGGSRECQYSPGQTEPGILHRHVADHRHRRHTAGGARQSCRARVRPPC